MIGKRLGLLVFVLVFLAGVVQAELSITEPSKEYNLGDKLFVTATGLKGAENGNLNIDLSCPDKEINILKISARAFPEDGGGAYSIPYKYLTTQDLEVENTSMIIGKCSIKASLAGELIETKDFLISEEVDVSASLDKVRYDPSEKAKLTIKAKRADGEPFIGQFELTNLTNKKGEITEEDNGKKVYEFGIDKTKPPGEYFLGVKIYDKGPDGKILNKGEEKVLVIVNQVPVKIKTAVSKNEITPGEPLKVSPKIVDQSGGTVEGTITMYLSDPDENKFDYNVESGETIEIPFATNATKGIWELYFVADELRESSELNVLGVERVNFSVANDVLTVKNTGNIEYYGIVDVKIGDKVQDVEVRLDLNEKKEYVLEAPEGEYEIFIEDGENKHTTKGFLTGNAVNVRERGASLGSSFSIMWIFLVFLGGSLGIVMIGVYRRSRSKEKVSFKEKIKGFSGFKKLKKKKEESNKQQESGSRSQEEYQDHTKNEKESAQSLTKMTGEKLKSVLLVIKLKDREVFSQDVQDDLVRIIKEGSSPKSVVDIKGDFIYFIYSPLVTKSYRNEYEAVKAARGIKKKLDNYNKGMSGELEYGIGVHTGELISRKEGKKLKYVSVGTIFMTANKMADAANNDVFISEALKKRLLRDVKTEKAKGYEDKGYYVIKEVKNKEQNKRKLEDMMSRMKKDEGA